VRKNKGAPVVIMRKDKRINHKLLHLFAFAATGGASGIVTAAEAANHAAYNARTRKLQAQAEEPEEPEQPVFTEASHSRARTSAQKLMARTKHEFSRDPQYLNDACKFCGRGRSFGMHTE
jgi:hypothetical protein